MEKRQYITPKMLIVRIVHRANILTGSPGITTNEESADENVEVL